jgi:hypothetical protein
VVSCRRPHNFARARGRISCGCTSC